jgi:hypothetical protein
MKHLNNFTKHTSINEQQKSFPKPLDPETMKIRQQWNGKVVRFIDPLTKKTVDEGKIMYMGKDVPSDDQTIKAGTALQPQFNLVDAYDPKIILGTFMICPKSADKWWLNRKDARQGLIEVTTKENKLMKEMLGEEGTDKPIFKREGSRIVPILPESSSDY